MSVTPTYSTAKNIGALITDILVQGESALSEAQNQVCDLTTTLIPAGGPLKKCFDAVKSYRNEIMNTILALSLLYCYKESPKIMNTRVFAAGTVVGFLGSTVMQSNEFSSMKSNILGHTEAQGYGAQKLMATLALLNTYIDNNFRKPASQKQAVFPKVSAPDKPMLAQEVQEPPAIKEGAIMMAEIGVSERVINERTVAAPCPPRVETVSPTLEETAPMQRPAYWGHKVALAFFSGVLAGNSMAHMLKDVNIVKTVKQGMVNVIRAIYHFIFNSPIARPQPEQKQEPDQNPPNAKALPPPPNAKAASNGGSDHLGN